MCARRFARVDYNDRQCEQSQSIILVFSCYEFVLPVNQSFELEAVGNSRVPKEMNRKWKK